MSQIFRKFQDVCCITAYVQLRRFFYFQNETVQNTKETIHTAKKGLHMNGLEIMPHISGSKQWHNLSESRAGSAEPTFDVILL